MTACLHAWLRPARRTIAAGLLLLFTLAVLAASATLAAGLPAIILPEGYEILEDEGVVCLPVTLSEPSGLPVSVRVTTIPPQGPSAAIPHQDYIPLNGRLEFPPGLTEREICLRILDDETDEFAGYFLLAFSEPVNATLNLASVEYFIRDNDGPAFLRIDQWPTPPSIAPGEVLTYTYQIWSVPLIEDTGRTARLDVTFDPPEAIASLEIVESSFEPAPPARIGCGAFAGGMISCTISDLTTDPSAYVVLLLTTASDFNGALNATGRVTGIRGTTNTNPHDTDGPQTVLVAHQLWSTYTPVLYGIYDYALTGLHVLNAGLGAVRLKLPDGQERDFPPGINEWWFPMAGGRQVVNATSSSGPCQDVTYLGGNTYNIEIDFASGELRHLNFVCMDASRPPDGSAWILYYYLEP